MLTPLAALALLLPACRAPDKPDHTGTTPLTEAPPDAPRVIIAVMDGVRVEECTGDGVHPSLTGEAASSLTPALHADLIPDAAVVLGARNLGVTTTYDAHTELLTGLRQPLVTFPTGEGDLWRSEAPTLFELLRRQGDLTADQALLIANTPLIGELTWGLWPGLGPDLGATWRFRTDASSADLRDAQVIEDLTGWLSAHDTRLAVVNLHRMDLAGHVEPDLSYLDRIREADPAVADLWRWIQQTPPYQNNTTLIVLADHGRHRAEEPDAWKNHGDQCSGCRDIPLIIAGPGVLPGAYPLPATLADVAATAARALDLDLPLGRGRPLTELYGLPPAPDDAPGRISAVDSVDAAGNPAVAYALEAGAGIASEGIAAGLLPSPDRLAPGLRAEAPSLLQTGGGLLACWRELDPLGIWAARCVFGYPETGPRDTAFPAAEGSSNWEAALIAAASPDAPDPGAWIAWIHNPSGDAGAPLVRPRIGYWDGAGWLSDADSPPEVSYPTRPSLSRSPGAASDAAPLRLAAATSDDEPTGRDSRSITVWEISPADTWARQSWRQILQIRPDAAHPRLDHPALRPDGGALAWIGLAPGGGSTIFLQGDPAAPAAPAAIATGAIPLLGLHWWDDGGDPSLVWAQQTADGIEIVRWNGTAHTYPTGQPWAAGLALTPTGAALSTPAGVVVIGL